MFTLKKAYWIRQKGCVQRVGKYKKIGFSNYESLDKVKAYLDEVNKLLIK